MAKPKQPETVPTNCPKCKRGALFDVTSRLAAALGNKQVKCDQCRYQAVYKVSE